MRDRSRTTGALVVMAVVILTTAAVLVGVTRLRTEPAIAQCSGSGCLPGSGYTFDRTWNCGSRPAGTKCWWPGYIAHPSGRTHSWGFGSADYDGSGQVNVTVTGCSWIETTQCLVHFSASATNLARACWYASCNDQDHLLVDLWVRNNQGPARVIGHGKA